jgi:protease-4
MLGSIGVYCALLDETESLKMQGLQVNLITAGKYKAMGAPFKPLTDDERVLLQERTNKIYDMFTSAVQAKRPQVSIETMQGQTFFGDENVAVGLSDGIVNSLDDALRAF